MKGTFLGVQSPFTKVSRLRFRDLPENPNLALYEDTLLRKQNTVKAVYCIILHVFPETPTIAIWAH